MKSKKTFRIATFLLAFIILNSNCLVVLNALKVQKNSTNSTNSLQPGKNNRLERQATLKKLIPSLNKNVEGKEISIAKKQNRILESHEKSQAPARLAKAQTKIDPITAALIVQYTAAAINKLLDYGISKIKDATKNVYRQMKQDIDNAETEWKLVLETQCFFFRTIRQITKIYMLSSSYDQFVKINGDYEQLQTTIKSIDSIREKIVSFLDQKVLDSCGEADDFLMDYLELAEGKKAEIDEEIKKLSDESDATAANSLTYVVKQLKESGPPEENNSNKKESTFEKVFEIFSDELEVVNDAQEDLSGDGAWKDFKDVLKKKTTDDGEEIMKKYNEEGYELDEHNKFAENFQKNIGKFTKYVGPVVSSINIYKEIKDRIDEKGQKIIGNKAYKMEKYRKAVAIAIQVIKIVEKIVEWVSGGDLPEWTKTLDAGLELLEKFLKYKSLVYAKEYATTLDTEAKANLEAEITKCRLYELSPAAVKFAALLFGSILLGALRAIFGPFIGAIFNVLKMGYKIYKLVSSIIGYFRAKQERRELMEYTIIIQENISRHYSFEKCSAVEQLYDMIEILETEQKKNEIDEKQSKVELSSKDPNVIKEKKLAFMINAVEDDVNVFLSTFSEKEIKEAEAYQKTKNSSEMLLTEKIFYRKMQSAINSIVVARSKEAINNLLLSGFSQYAVLGENLSIMVCRGCSNKFAVSAIESAKGKSLKALIIEMKTYNAVPGQRMNLINIGIEKTKPVYIKIFEKEIVSDNSIKFVTDFEFTLKPEEGIIKINKKKYNDNGLYENSNGIDNYNQKAVLILLEAKVVREDFDVKYKSLIKLIQLWDIWLIMVFNNNVQAVNDFYNEVSDPKHPENAVSFVDFSSGIKNIYSFLYISESDKDKYESTHKYFKENSHPNVDGLILTKKELLVKSSSVQLPWDVRDLNILEFLKSTVLCSSNIVRFEAESDIIKHTCFFKDTPINQIYRINDEDAFKDLISNEEDHWVMRHSLVKCRNGELLDFKVYVETNYKMPNVIEVCSKTDNRLEYDKSYILRYFKDAGASKYPSFGDISKMRRGFLPLYKHTLKQKSGEIDWDFEIYVRPSFEMGWVPLGLTLDEHEKKKEEEETCWNEFFTPEDLLEEYKEKQKIYNQYLKVNKHMHYLRSYRAYLEKYRSKSTSNPELKPAKRLPSLKYYRYKYGIYLAAKTNNFFINYADVLRQNEIFDNKKESLDWLSKIHRICNGKHAFLPAQLEENSTGLTFEVNSSGDVFLQETSEEGLFPIHKVYYIEIFGFDESENKTPQMNLKVGKLGMPSDHRQLFDYGFRPLLVPFTLGTDIKDGVLVSSKENLTEKTAFRIWIREDLRLKHKREEICQFS